MARRRRGRHLQKLAVADLDRCCEDRILGIKQMVPKTDIRNLNLARKKSAVRKRIVYLRAERDVNAICQNIPSSRVIAEQIIGDKRPETMSC